MLPERQKATVEEFRLITDLEHHKNKLVHVEGWAKGFQFLYRETIMGVHHLITPTTRRRYMTTNRLLHTRRQIEEAKNA